MTTWQDRARALTNDPEFALGKATTFEDALVKSSLTANERIECEVKREFWLAYAIECEAERKQAEYREALAAFVPTPRVIERHEFVPDALTIEVFDPDKGSLNDFIQG